jgi:AcrR family transcriptional regulator
MAKPEAVPPRAVPGRTPARRPAPAGPSLGDRKRQLVRDEITRVAWALFDRKGYEATTVEAIAAAAGISRRSFFRYYSSKEDVAVGTSDDYAEDYLAAFARRPKEEPPLVSIQRVLRSLIAERVADVPRSVAIVRLLRRSRTLRRAMLERHARLEERLAVLIAERTGADARRDPGPVLLAFLARALSDTAFNVWYDQRPADVGAMVDGLFPRLRAIVTGEHRPALPRATARVRPVRSKGRSASAGRSR